MTKEISRIKNTDAQTKKICDRETDLGQTYK